MTKLLKSIAVVTALSLAASSALASEGRGRALASAKTEKAQADFGVGKFYLKGLVGWNFAGKEKVTAAVLNGGEVKIKKNNAFRFGVGVGAEVVEHLRLEFMVDFGPSKTYNKTENNVKKSLKATSNVNTMLFAHYDLGNMSGVTPFVTAGLGWSHNKYTATTTVTGQAAISAKTKGSFFAYAVGAGLGYDISKDLISEISYLYNGVTKNKSGVKGKAEGHAVNLALRFKL